MARKSQDLYAEDEQVPVDFFRVNKILLKLALIYYPRGCVGNCLPLIYLSAHFFFISTDIICLFTEKDMKALASIVLLLATHISTIIKIIFWFSHNDEIRQIMRVLQQKRFFYEDTGDFAPTKLFMAARRTAMAMSIGFYIFCDMAIISAFVPFFYMVLFDGKTTGRLPFFNWIPIEYNTKSTYFWVLIYQQCFLLNYCTTIAAFDSLFMAIESLISVHVSVVSGAFETCKQRSLNKHKQDGGSLDQVMFKELVRCIQHLQFIFKLCQRVEAIFKYCILTQVLTTLFLLCTALFTLTTSQDGIMDVTGKTFYLISASWQLMLYCWHANEISVKAQNIPGAIWKSDWLDTPKKYQTCLLITMVRMKRPLYFTIGNFSPLTLVTFMSMAKTSYSVFALLRRVYKE